MTPLIAMPGPWLPEAIRGRGPAVATAIDAGAAGLPPLPALTRLLRRARRLPDASDWRAGVTATLTGEAQFAAAAVAARACDLPAGTAVCLAAPLHVVAGISRVHLPPGGQLWLQPAEEQELCAAFNAMLDGEGVRLHVAAAGGGWLLQAPFAAAARDAAPETQVGATLQRRPAEGPQQRALRRLGAETEMWLATLPLNEARQARGELPVNALWFWGGAQARPLPPLQGPLCIGATGVADAWLAGLAAHAAVPVRAVSGFDAAFAAANAPGALPAALAASSPPALPAAAAAATGRMLLVPAPDNQGPSRHYWQMVEDNWIAPAVRAFEAGRIDGLSLQIGRSAWQWPRRGVAGWLRGHRGPWWQATGEAGP